MPQDHFGFLEVTCFSAALNALSADRFVNVPDLAPLNETGCLFVRHDSSPIDLPGHPLRDIYSSVMTFSSSRSKAIPCTPIDTWARYDLIG